MLDEHAPRIFTSNATEPCEWHECLPENVFTTSDQVDRGYSNHIKAVFKRTVFACCLQTLISDEMRTGHDAKRRRTAACRLIVYRLTCI